MVYTGQTQTTLKERTNQHCNDVKKLVERKITSDSFAAHMAEHFNEGSKVRASQVRKKIKIDIIWQGNAINCMKSFKKFCCTLCTRERCEIIKRTLKNENNTINNCSEIYGACRHNTKFHRFIKTDICTSTDDGVDPERVVAQAENAKKLDENKKLTRRASKPTEPILKTFFQKK
jgi:hypothetical protein